MGSLRKQPNGIALSVVMFLSAFYQGCLGWDPDRGYPPPPMCEAVECAPYQVTHSQKEFEIRIYSSSKWVASPVSTHQKSYFDGYREGFLLLFRYSRGSNIPAVRYDMTAPVLTHILPNSSFQVYSYLPEKFQKSPPLPYQNQGIKIVKLPRKKHAAVRRFGGRIVDASVAKELAALRKALRGTPWESAAASPDYGAADFNLPWQIMGRVNEIIMWFDQN